MEFTNRTTERSRQGPPWNSFNLWGKQFLNSCVKNINLSAWIPQTSSLAFLLKSLKKINVKIVVALFRHYGCTKTMFHSIKIRFNCLYHPVIDGNILTSGTIVFEFIQVILNYSICCRAMHLLLRHWAISKIWHKRKFCATHNLCNWHIGFTTICSVPGVIHGHLSISFGKNGSTYHISSPSFLNVTICIVFL